MAILKFQQKKTGEIITQCPHRDDHVMIGSMVCGDCKFCNGRNINTKTVNCTFVNVYYVVFLADEHLSLDSYRIMGVFSSEDEAIKQIMRYHIIPKEEVAENGGEIEIRRQLRRDRQTQGYQVNYIIKVHELDYWED